MTNAPLILNERCPDCGAKIAVPVSMKLDEKGTIWVVIDEEKLYEIMLTHVELNPDIHPTFTKEEEKT